MTVDHDLAAEQDQRISEVVAREQSRLRSFIRRWVPDESDAEDVLQEVFYELVEASRLLTPVEHLSGWLFRVARNRIVDLFRKRRPLSPGAAQSLTDNAAGAGAEDGADAIRIEDLLPSPDAGPEAAYARGVLLDELDAALDELPEEQRVVFVAHELEGASFRELAARTGLSENALRLRKHYAVTRLRRRLEAIHNDFAPGSGSNGSKSQGLESNRTGGRK